MFTWFCGLLNDLTPQSSKYPEAIPQILSVYLFFRPFSPAAVYFRLSNVDRQDLLRALWSARVRTCRRKYNLYTWRPIGSLRQ